MTDNKTEMAFSIYGKEASSRPSLVESDARTGYVKCGDDNAYYDYIYNTFTKSPLLQSAIETIHKYVANFTTESEQEDIEDMIDKLAFDYILFGGFALFVVRKFGKKHFQWIDFKNVRTNKDCDHFWYSRNWNTLRSSFVDFDKYDPNNETQEKSIYYFNGNTRRGENVYPTPSYSGALLDVETDASISEFWNSSINNNFNASAFITFCNGTPTDEVQHQIEEKIADKFTGTKNAGRFVLSFVDSKDQSVDIQRITEDNFDQKYQSLTSSLKERIFASLRINPILTGVNVATGFSKEEFASAYDLAYITVILPIQKVLTRQLKKLGVDVEFQKLIIYQEGGTDVESAAEMIDGNDKNSSQELILG